MALLPQSFDYRSRDILVYQQSHGNPYHTGKEYTFSDISTSPA